VSLKCFRVRGERTESVFTFVFALTPEEAVKEAKEPHSVEWHRRDTGAVVVSGVFDPDPFSRQHDKTWDVLSDGTLVRS